MLYVGSLLSILKRYMVMREIMHEEFFSHVSMNIMNRTFRSDKTRRNLMDVQILEFSSSSSFQCHVTGHSCMQRKYGNAV